MLLFFSLKATYKRVTSSCGVPPAAYDLFRILTLKSVLSFAEFHSECVNLLEAHRARSEFLAAASSFVSTGDIAFSFAHVTRCLLAMAFHSFTPSLARLCVCVRVCERVWELGRMGGRTWRRASNGGPGKPAEGGEQLAFHWQVLRAGS